MERIKEMFKRERSYLVNNHSMSFRPGQPALILGIDIVMPNENSPSRPCFHIQYSDFFEDWIPISDIKYCSLLTIDEVINSL